MYSFNLSVLSFLLAMMIASAAAENRETAIKIIRGYKENLKPFVDNKEFDFETIKNVKNLTSDVLQKLSDISDQLNFMKMRAYKICNERPKSNSNGRRLTELSNEFLQRFNMVKSLIPTEFCLSEENSINSDIRIRIRDDEIEIVRVESSSNAKAFTLKQSLQLVLNTLPQDLLSSKNNLQHTEQIPLGVLKQKVTKFQERVNLFKNQLDSSSLPLNDNIIQACDGGPSMSGTPVGNHDEDARYNRFEFGDKYTTTVDANDNNRTPTAPAFVDVGIKTTTNEQYERNNRFDKYRTTTIAYDQF